MASSKSRIRDSLAELIPEKAPVPGLLSRGEIFHVSKDIPKKGFDWTQCVRVMARSSATGGFSCHTLIDARQFIENLGPRDSGPDKPGERRYVPRWRDYTKGFCNRQKSIAAEPRKAGIVSFELSRTVLAYDNSPAVSKAKRPLQTIRRLGTLARFKPGEKIHLPCDPRKRAPYPLHPDDRVHPQWREAGHVWGAYQQRIVDLLNQTIEQEIAFPEHSGHEYWMWDGGKMFKTVPGAHKRELEDQTKAYASIGEYDHFIVRYMARTVIEAAQRAQQVAGIQPGEEAEISLKLKTVQDRSKMAFRLYTSDTDILLFALWTLEHLKSYLKLLDSQLPQVFMIYYRKPYRRINVTALFAALRYEMSRRRCAVGYESSAIRNLCAAYFAWGNDFLPHPQQLAPSAFGHAFVRMQSLLRTPLVDPAGEKCRMYPLAMVPNGGALRTLTTLAYYYKHRVCMRGARTPEKAEKERARIAQLAETCGRGRGLDDAEKYIRAAMASLKADKQVCSKRAMCARMQAVYTTIYCVDHALETVPGFNRSVNEAGLPDGAYVNAYKRRAASMSEERLELCAAIGLLTPERDTEWTRDVAPLKYQEAWGGKGRECVDELAWRVLTWPGREAARASSSSAL